MKTSTSVRSQLSPTRWPPEAFPWWGSLALAATLILATIVTLLICLVIVVTIRPSSVNEFRTLSWPVVIVQFVVDAVTLAILVVGLPKLARRPLSGIGLHPPQWRDVAWGLGGALGMLIVATLIGVVQESVFHLKADQMTVHWLQDPRKPLVAALVVLAVPLAPLVEELTFRGLVFNAILRYAPAWLAATISGILFGLSHGSTGVGSIAPLAAAGIILATVYYRSGSLVASMFTHGLFNAFTVIAVIGFHQK